MASLFKRLFSSGGTQTASVQVAEPSAEAAVAEETIEQAASQYQAAELQPPSEEELKEFLYKNFLDGAKPAEIPQAQEWSAANSPAVNAELAPTITPEEVAPAAASLTSEDEMMAEIEVDSMALDSPEVAAAFADELVARALPPTLTEIPEALRPTLTDVIEESQNAETESDEGVITPSLESTENLAGPSRIDSSE